MISSWTNNPPQTGHGHRRLVCSAWSSCSSVSSAFLFRRGRSAASNSPGKKNSSSIRYFRTIPYPDRRTPSPLGTNESICRYNADAEMYLNPMSRSLRGNSFSKIASPCLYKSSAVCIGRFSIFCLVNISYVCNLYYNLAHE